MKSDLREEREKIVASLGLDEDESWALNDMFHSAEFEFLFGLDAKQERSNLVGAITFLTLAQKINQDQAEELWMLWNKYEAEGLKKNG